MTSWHIPMGCIWIYNRFFYLAVFPMGKDSSHRNSPFSRNKTKRIPKGWTLGKNNTKENKYKQQQNTRIP